MMSKDRNTAAQAGSDWASLSSVRQYVATAARFYDSAVTMTLGHVDSAHPWLLPRIPFYPENSTLFARLKILLKCGSLRAPKQRCAAA